MKCYFSMIQNIMEREKMSLKSQSWNWQFSGRVQHERQRKWGSYKLVLPLLTNKCKWNWEEICLKLGWNMFEIGKKYFWNWEEICLKLGKNMFEIGKKCVWNWEEMCLKCWRNMFRFTTSLRHDHSILSNSPTLLLRWKQHPRFHHHHHHLVIISVKLLYKFNFSWLIFFLFSLLHWRMRILKTSFASSSKPWWRRAKLAGCRFQEIIICIWLGIRRKYLCRFQEIIYDLQFNRRKYSCRFQKIILDLERILIWENIL